MLLGSPAACGDDSDDDETRDASVDAAVSGKGGNAGKSGAGGKGGNAGDAGTSVCVVDVPCLAGAAYCMNDHQLQKLRNAPCEEVCGDRLPCSGGTCRNDGTPQDCPAGQVCVGSRSNSPTATAHCAAEADASL